MDNFESNKKVHVSMSVPIDAKDALDHAAMCLNAMNSQQLGPFERQVGNFVLDRLHRTFLELYTAMSETESPIETMVLLDLMVWRSHFQNVDKPSISSQVQIDRYRVDFLVEYEDQRIVVECDGHEFHEKTKEQAQRDKQRDRDLVRLGYMVVRFTGSEIWKNPRMAADYLDSVLKPNQLGESQE